MTFFFGVDVNNCVPLPHNYLMVFGRIQRRKYFLRGLCWKVVMKFNKVLKAQLHLFGPLIGAYMCIRSEKEKNTLLFSLLR